MFKTIIEFMDGTTREYPSRHLARFLPDATCYHLVFKREEVDFPLCNIRSIRTVVIEEIPEEEDARGIIDGDQAPKKKKDGRWTFNNPFKKEDKS